MKLPPELERKLAIKAAKDAISATDSAKDDMADDAGSECECPKCGFKGPEALFEASPSEGEPIAAEDD